MFNVELEKVSLWTKANALSMNLAKTCAVLFSIRPVGDFDDLLLMDGEGVQFEQSAQFLGIAIDNQLNKTKMHICNKISKTIGTFCKLKYILPMNILINIYYSFVYPYLLYCPVVPGGTHAASLVPLMRLHEEDY